jgi:hypothetical protein
MVRRIPTTRWLLGLTIGKNYNVSTGRHEQP